MENECEYAIGIDLGTTFSCIGVYRDGKVEIISDDQVGASSIPSMVAFKGIDRLIGHGAYNQASKNPTNTVFEAKRMIGKKFDDPEL